jgi:hypothetical protein
MRGSGKGREKGIKALDADSVLRFGWFISDVCDECRRCHEAKSDLMKLNSQFHGAHDKGRPC